MSHPGVSSFDGLPSTGSGRTDFKLRLLTAPETVRGELVEPSTSDERIPTQSVENQITASLFLLIKHYIPGLYH